MFPQRRTCKKCGKEYIVYFSDVITAPLQPLPVVLIDFLKQSFNEFLEIFGLNMEPWYICTKCTGGLPKSSEGDEWVEYQFVGEYGVDEEDPIMKERMEHLTEGEKINVREE